MEEQDGYETANCYDCREDPENLIYTGPDESIEDHLFSPAARGGSPLRAPQVAGLR
jgi:hypothetical protein